MIQRMITSGMLAVLLFGAEAAPLRLEWSHFDDAHNWRVWSARDEIRPRAFVDHTVWRSAPDSLAIYGNGNPSAYGGWERTVSPVRPGQWYRLTVYYRTAAVQAENWQVVARLDWQTSGGKRAGQPDYAYRARREGAWTRLVLEAPAPPDAAAATVQLYLANSSSGTVWWDDLTLEEIPAPAPRKIQVAAVNLRPSSTGAPEISVERFLDTVEREVPQGVDVILLPEGITVIGTGKTYADVAEAVPGPTTEKLAAMARKKRSWIVAGIYEREGHTLYNTSLLVDRQGRLAGRYRKVYLPREEVERGLTPGDDYPVFHTDFGTVGMMICYDVFFPDPARALAARGAELILMPIWGGDEVLAKARAIENKVFLVSSGYDFPTYVMDPDGEILALAREQGQVALAEIDLSKRYWHPHLGDMKARRAKEWRRDVKMPFPALEE